LYNTALDYLIGEGLGQYIDFGALDQVFESERHGMMAAVDPENRIPFPPVPADLARLH
jgi:hypothetical protein